MSTNAPATSSLLDSFLATIKPHSDSLLEFAKNNKYHVPAAITNCTMKPYQVTGLNWLVAMYKQKIGGILGDDMVQQENLIIFLGTWKNIANDCIFGTCATSGTKKWTHL